MRISDIIVWINENNVEYDYAGDKDTEIIGFSSLRNYKKDTVTWVKKEQNYTLCNRPREIDFAIVEKGIKVDFKNALYVKNSKELFFLCFDIFGEKKKMMRE